MQKLPGVAKVDIDSDTRTAVVSGEAVAFSAADAVEALKSRGFPADTVKALEFASAAGTEAPAAEDAAAPAESAEKPAAEEPPTSAEEPEPDAPKAAPAKDAAAPAESTEAPAKE